jgi:uncharacterized membrane protein YphA (DoxX/SURF4 family)
LRLRHWGNPFREAKEVTVPRPFALAADSIPGRLTTGAYILHSGLAKLRGGPEQAQGTHKAASKAYPFLAPVPPAVFLRALGASEVAVGSALLLPLVPDALAGAALTAFAAALLGMYARTPDMRQPHSIWPSRAGIAVSKDVWMVGVGLGLVLKARRAA